MRVARGPVENNGTEPTGSVVVSDIQRRRSRFRTRASTDEELGVVVDAARVLSTGDLLETDDGDRFVVELDSVEALVVEFAGANDSAAMVVAGHAVGNRHWDLVAHEGRVYVPAGEDAENRIDFLQSVLSSDATVTVESVEPTLFDEDESDSHQTGHSNGHHHGDGHAHDDGHDHTHAHTHPHDHEHGPDTHEHTDTTTMTRERLKRLGQEGKDE